MSRREPPNRLRGRGARDPLRRARRVHEADTQGAHPLHGGRLRLDRADRSSGCSSPSRSASRRHRSGRPSAAASGKHGRWSFLDVNDRERAVVLDLTGHEYRRLVLTVDDPGVLRAEAARAPARPLDLDAHPAVLDPNRERVDGLEGRECERCAGRDVEPRAVAGADRDALVRIPLALAERAVVVRAAILECVELPLQL